MELRNHVCTTRLCCNNVIEAALFELPYLMATPLIILRSDANYSACCSVLHTVNIVFIEIRKKLYCFPESLTY